ncbi:MAG: primosomal replication protein N'' [Yokenella regensburgei]|uniref:Primosomal replication protein N n=1 Tax=Yokenella regensburgei TaxID=158877 RepID=A0AB38FU89_9ENTR|nr:primosomal replication protein N'' [Yokenella regensburgei]KFD23984.1 primosomal replication protein N'' [Yokenella regensburgei ATCC 49455]MDR3105777.1 primosomal replication protein N'' [Yokenella regensburgei]SQA62235.1 Primosomal replication protein N'' [Yokenella regensburgei]SQA68212.1 Primosomal replication protein N'' [Yokenella regensburgei]SUQ06526.1 Primosomal replication protein N'' [Yokenella regensburgei]
MKTDLLLHTLEQQLAQLEARVGPLAHFATLGPRFDRQLFQTRSPLLQDCLEETRHHLTALKQAIEKQQLPQIVWLAERLAAQVEAISRETAAWSLRSWDSGSPSLIRWQRKRLQHQEYERRLLEMTQERQRQLAQTQDFTEQQRLTREVEAFSGRLTRCRKALQGIDAVIARMTR